MGGANSKAIATDRHAKRIAALIAKGRPPALTDDMDLYFGLSHEIFAAFEGAARHMPPAARPASGLKVLWARSRSSRSSSTQRPRRRTIGR